MGRERDGLSCCISFDPVAEDYDATRYLPPEIQERAARLLLEVAGLAPGQVWLDAGVGTGRFALPLAQLGVPVVGADIALGMMAQLHAKRAAVEKTGPPLPLRTARGDLRRLPLASGAFGAVLMVHILHLIVEWQSVLAEVRRVLAPGGALLLASEVGERRWMPTYDHYCALARERGVLSEHPGMRKIEEALAFLQAGGAQIRRVETGIRWRVETPVGVTLARLRRRSWSNLWPIPDAVHAEIMAETEAWARRTFDSLEALETGETSFTVQEVRWPLA
ncbi:MAG TPA: class I SAM-dependent methyltransferase [Chthonomonadaceae bacterium]|nr:class I SAM-dependent methyltransferase [Chthonomonadaceae bacterium]